MYNFSAKFRSIFRILSVYLMSLLMFSGNSYGMESNKNQGYGALGNSNLDDNKSVSINDHLNIAIFGEDEEEVNKIAHLLFLNGSGKDFENCQLIYRPNVMYEAKNNKELKFVVIPYKYGSLDQTIRNIFGEKSFDYFDFIIHVSNKDTLTADRIKHFYDKLNYAWLGKDYAPMYSPFGSLKDMFWKKALENYGGNDIPRTLFFIFNGDTDELYKLDEYSTVKNYISAMPDSRSIYGIGKDNTKFYKIIRDTNELSAFMRKELSLNRTNALNKILEKKKWNSSVLEQNLLPEQQSSCWSKIPLIGDCLKTRVSN